MSGGAARVEDPEVVAAPIDAWRHQRAGDQRLVADGPVGHVVAADLDPQPNVAQTLSHVVEAFGECRVEEHRQCVAVVDEVLELGLDIAIVDVAGRGAHLERPELGLEVLVTVEQRARHVVAGADAGRVQGPRHVAGALLELGPRARHAPAVQCQRSAPVVGDRLPCGRQVHRSTPRRGLFAAVSIGRRS